MEQLYLETMNGNLPINEEITKKYNLKKGIKSPFTQNRIVDKNGDYFLNQAPKNSLSDENSDDERTKSDGFAIDESDKIFQTSEILDFSQGADSN